VCYLQRQQWHSDGSSKMAIMPLATERKSTPECSQLSKSVSRTSFIRGRSLTLSGSGEVPFDLGEITTSTQDCTLQINHPKMRFLSTLLLFVAPIACLHTRPSSSITAFGPPNTAAPLCPGVIPTSLQPGLPSTSSIPINQTRFSSRANETHVQTFICPPSNTNTWNPSIDTLIAIFFGIVAAILQLNHIHVARRMFSRKLPRSQARNEKSGTDEDEFRTTQSVYKLSSNEGPACICKEIVMS